MSNRSSFEQKQDEIAPEKIDSPLEDPVNLPAADILEEQEDEKEAETAKENEESLLTDFEDEPTSNLEKLDDKISKENIKEEPYQSDDQDFDEFGEFDDEFVDAADNEDDDFGDFDDFEQAEDQIEPVPEEPKTPTDAELYVTTN